MPQTTQPRSPRKLRLVQQEMQKLCRSATIEPHPGQRGGRMRSSSHRPDRRAPEPQSAKDADVNPLHPCPRRAWAAQAAPMTRPLFDPSLLPVRQARAEALGGDFFLHERAFDECLDRIFTVRKKFAGAWLLGAERPGWRERLASFGITQVGFARLDADLPDFRPDLCISIGALDTAEDIPPLLAAIRHMLAPDGLFIGAFAGGHSLPKFRSAMAAADLIDGYARPHFHPPIDPASFGGLLTGAGFVDPIADIDRVTLTYASMAALVRDLRGMGATNRLLERSRRPISRRALAAAKENFAAASTNGRTNEILEIIYFAAWSPQDPAQLQG